MANDSSGTPNKQDGHSCDTQLTEDMKGPWETPVIRRENGDPVGVSLHLRAEDLVELGIDPDVTTNIHYGITQNGGIRLLEKQDDPR